MLNTNNREMAMDLKTSFDILGIGPQTNATQAKHAYKAQVRRWHPDQFPQGSTTKAGAEEHLKQINIAYARVKAHLAMQWPASNATDKVTPTYRRQTPSRRPKPVDKKTKRRSWIDHLFDTLNTLAGNRDSDPSTNQSDENNANQHKTFEQVLDEMGHGNISPKSNRPSGSSASRPSAAGCGHIRRKGGNVGAVGGTESSGPVKPVGRVRGIGRSR